MARKPLPPDLEALEMWRNLPQNKPSRHALPPITGGSRWLGGLLFLMVALAIAAVIFQITPH